jgi:hypothetical protein
MFSLPSSHAIHWWAVLHEFNNIVCFRKQELLGASSITWFSGNDRFISLCSLTKVLPVAEPVFNTNFFNSCIINSCSRTSSGTHRLTWNGVQAVCRKILHINSIAISTKN